MFDSRSRKHYEKLRSAGQGMQEHCMEWQIVCSQCLRILREGCKSPKCELPFQLGLLAFVIYPVLPDHPVDPWQLINPREAWLTLVVIAVLEFTNYLLLKLYSSRGLYYSAVLGGMVNNTATIAELSGLLAGVAENKNISAITTTIDFLTIVAMFLRNLLILGMFCARWFTNRHCTIDVMSVAALACIWQQRKRSQGQIGEVDGKPQRSSGAHFVHSDRWPHPATGCLAVLQIRAPASICNTAHNIFTSHCCVPSFNRFSGLHSECKNVMSCCCSWGVNPLKR
jgi:hypothetical protein